MCNRIILVLLFLSFVIRIHASSISIEGNQSNLNVADELQTKILLTVNAPDDTTYYLRGVFYQPDTTNYCGYTWNGTSWISDPGGWSNFLTVRIKDSTWSGELKAKIDTQDTGCRQSGSYHFKVRRFTESGNETMDEQNNLVLNITVPTPTLTITPTTHPTYTPKPSTTHIPTNTVKPTIGIVPTATNLPTSRPYPTITATPTRRITPTGVTETPHPSITDVLTPENPEIISDTPTPDEKQKSSVFRPTAIALLFVGIGLAVLSVAIFLQTKYSRKDTI